jgi:hypothetical protein
MATIVHSRREFVSVVAEDPTGSRADTSETAGADGEDSARRKQCPRNTTKAHN